MKIIEKAKLSFKKNRISLNFFNTVEEFYLYINTLIKPYQTIGVGDSISLEDIGLYNYLRNSKVNFLDKYKENLNKEDKRKIYIDNFSADIFFSGINALSAEGKIYNLDGNGSRVAPIIYGPKKVILVCGINKLVDNEEAALKRIKEIAAPLDGVIINCWTQMFRLV